MPGAMCLVINLGYARGALQSAIQGFRPVDHGRVGAGGVLRQVVFRACLSMGGLIPAGLLVFHDLEQEEIVAVLFFILPQFQWYVFSRCVIFIF